MSLWDGISPVLTGCLPLGEAVPGLKARALLHAGPAFDGAAAMPRPVVNAAVAAVLAEGWADAPEAAERMIRAGEVALRPAQEVGVVTPLACVVSQSMPVLVVEAGGVKAFSPVSDGGLDGALRFGAANPAGQVARIGEMAAMEGPLRAAIGAGVALMPLMSQAIAAGDDLHGSVAAMSAGLADRLGMSGAADAYARMPLFALNAVMAAAAVMLKAGAARAPEPMVMAAGGNGVAFGWMTSKAPGVWQVRPATTPEGPRMDNGAARVLPAIGDSAVIDALGLGGPILRHAPALREALAPFHGAEVFDASPAFMAPHPELPEDIHLGCAAARLGQHPGIMLAMLGAEGEGLVGRGLAGWPGA
ncbi:oxamate carbamoyltransferase subunit AllG family protein [Vannielia sp. SX4]|uniref:oxamate carbamoyltransferase subunit AllG family protein n=1 Tax=Vannielia sp. SX4 TaxID=3463852 RepID=UPI0040583FC7